ncbi:MAG TPA: tripartite tricarboxylate transporter substrate binding protein [Acidiferrobacterales bacterium]|nr:tripartite tricarboxylate transporter substrate binding protein [Acidiferrobacterales bacterium]
MKTTRMLGCMIAMLLAGAALGAQAENYPSKPIKMIVPFSVGGTTDILARIIGQELTKAWGQQVIIDNRPGAGGNIGADLVAKSAPDGYTLVMGTVGTHAINASLYKKMPYDTVKDFAPITLVAAVPNVLVVHPAVPAKSVKELIEYAKANPGKLSFASSGNGTSVHLSGELFKAMAGVSMTHIPYKGSAPAIIDLMGGQVQLMFDNMPTALPHVKAGRLRALAVTSAKRSPAMPDLPTIAEAGVAGYEAESWFGVLAPAGTPSAIVTKLNGEIVRILGLPEIKERLLSQGAEPVGNSPEQFAAHITAEMAKWGNVVKASGAQVD